MKVDNILSILNEISPFELQSDWDNCGLNVGGKKDNFNQIYLSLDVSLALIKKLPKNSLLITHHPLLFKSIKKINSDDFPSSIIKKMIKKNISHIAMHTNFDKTHLNRYVFEKILGFNTIKCEGYICYTNVDTTLKKLIKSVKKNLKLSYTKYVKSKKKIKTIALTTGSGASQISFLDVDLLLTADVKYHDAMLAKEKNISLIDIGHYESERYFVDILKQELKIKSISAIITDSKNPFQY